MFILCFLHCLVASVTGLPSAYPQNFHGIGSHHAITLLHLYTTIQGQRMYEVFGNRLKKDYVHDLPHSLQGDGVL